MKISTIATTSKTSPGILQVSFLYRLFLDILILISLCALSRKLPLYLREATGNDAAAEATSTIGFFCDDNSLKYPYREETITERRLYQFALQLPLAVIFIVELLRFREHQTNCIDFLLQLYRPVGRFLFGYAAERCLKAIASHYFLRLRPNFFEVCQPHEIGSGGGTNICAALYNTKEYHEYIVRYACSSTPLSVFTSFYSGHASLICYGMVFMLLYLQQRYVWHRTQYLQHVLQLICLLLAWCISLSRIWDHMHHATDVAVGAILGATFAVIAMHFIAVVGNCEQGEVAVNKSNVASPPPRIYSGVV